MKVGADPADDARRVGMVREEIGPDRHLMIDANQRWDVDEAIERVRALARFDLLWIEEPTSPDDVLGHAAIARAVAPIGVATGEHCANRVLFKQLLQAQAISFCQIDSCRLGGVNENLAVILMAREVRRPGLPARRRRRAVRARAAPVDVGLPRGVGPDGRPRHRVRRPPARALRRSRRRPARPLPGARARPATAARSSANRGTPTGIPTGRCGPRSGRKGINNRRMAGTLTRRNFLSFDFGDRTRDPDHWVRIHRVAMACRFEVMLSSDDARRHGGGAGGARRGRRPRVAC